MSEKKPTSSNTGLSDISFVKTISLGSIDSNTILTDEEKERQVSLLNRMLNEFPKGRIIGKDITLVVAQAGDEQVTLQKTTYHIGFKRKPDWLG